MNIRDTLEPTCVSKLTGDIKLGSSNGDSFYITIYRGNTKLAITFTILDLHLERNQFINKLEQNLEMISQIFGLYKIWGHPTLEPLEGTSALEYIATQVRGLHEPSMSSITVKFKEEFIMRYLRKENKWPELDISELSPVDPIRLAYQHIATYPKHHKSYNRDNLLLVNFKPLFPMDSKFDLVEMIADKAMSLFTPDLIHHLVSFSKTFTAK